MRTTIRPTCFTRQSLALTIALAASSSAQAINFNIGEIEGQLDSSLSVGASWSLRGADPDLVGSANFAHNGRRGTGLTQTGDDGRLNFKKGETFSKIFKGIHDLELKYGDSGVFVRGKYWYDFELKDESRLFKDIDDSNRKQAAQASGAEILDAFVYHNYEIAGLPGSVRAGRQVVSWGESTFTGNGINAINPIDAAAFRRPGAEIREGLIPVNMLYVSQGLTDQLSAEAFYQLEWDQTVIDNCGTFFASSDVVADGCTDNYTILDPTNIGTLQAAQAGLFGAGAQFVTSGLNVVDEGMIVRRGGDRDARDDGQYGLALRWLGDDTEYGAYMMNYHSRTPNSSLQTAEADAIFLAGLSGPLEPLILIGSGQYFLEYPEDIRLYGASFATALPSGTAWSGEISHRPNMPLGINGTDMTNKLASSVTGLDSANQYLRGYNRKEVTQAQTTLTHFFDQVMGADRFTLVGELAYTRIGGLESQSEVRYGRDSIYGASGNHGFYTSGSWGYRMRGIWDYSDVFAGVNLKPSISWSDDVDGYGPVFNEGSKAVSFGVDADYASTYTASLSYTDFFGGEFNTAVDRDFVALSFGVNF